MTARDPYWSRHGTNWEIIPRQDPVRWGSTPGPLTSEELAFFEENGYLIKQSLLDRDTVDALLAEGERLAREYDPRTRHDVITEPDSDVIRSIFRVHRDNPVYRGLAADERLAGTARQIVGSDVYIHQSRINFKPELDGKEFYWHSDFETWHTEDGMPRMRALSVSIALSDNYALNGPLMLVPGSHRHYVTCTGATPDDNYKKSLRAQEIGTPDDDSLRWLVDQGGIDAPTGPAGSIVMFDCNTMHGSNGNITPLPRSNIFAVYNSIENALLPPFAGTRPRPDFIASRIVDPIA